MLLISVLTFVPNSVQEAIATTATSNSISPYSTMVWPGFLWQPKPDHS
jgi:hypothetical protein